MQLDKEETQRVILNSKCLTVVLEYLDILFKIRGVPILQYKFLEAGECMFRGEVGDIVMEILRHVNETAS